MEPQISRALQDTISFFYPVWSHISFIAAVAIVCPPLSVLILRGIDIDFLASCYLLYSCDPYIWIHSLYVFTRYSKLSTLEKFAQWFSFGLCYGCTSYAVVSNAANGLEIPMHMGLIWTCPNSAALTFHSIYFFLKEHSLLMTCALRTFVSDMMLVGLAYYFPPYPIFLKEGKISCATSLVLIHAKGFPPKLFAWAYLLHQCESIPNDLIRLGCELLLAFLAVILPMQDMYNGYFAANLLCVILGLIVLFRSVVMLIADRGRVVPERQLVEKLLAKPDTILCIFDSRKGSRPSSGCTMTSHFLNANSIF